MYRFDWNVFLTTEFINSVRTRARLEPGDIMEPALKLLRDIFSMVGGLEFTERPYSEAERTAIANKLLHEAVLHTLHLARPESIPPGYVISSSGKEYERNLTAIKKVVLNTATAAELDALPFISTEVAAAIVNERATRGPFNTMQDLIKRVKGIGPDIALKLTSAIRFDSPQEILRQGWQITGDPEADFSTLLSLQSGRSSAERLTAALSMLATNCAAHPHPAREHLLIRDFLLPEVAAPISIPSLGVLFGYEYFLQVPGLLRAAASSIEVCMFHIAYTSDKHPTRKLLDALVEARQKGLAVRVLLDQDRKADPYASTIINGPAKKYLEEHGVSCKFDRQERLLHSKYLIIDNSLLIIGSHNWSAGSFFQYDDLSLAVRSPELAAQQISRFNAFWDAN
jgi:DNA uptake protein ComE-like DNA-binding protein